MFENLITKQLGSIIRNALAAAGGALLSKQIVDPATWESFATAATNLVVAAAPWLVAQAWSWVRNKNLATGKK